MSDASAVSRNPNIILVNCDDLGYGDLGCYGSACNDTPHLDRLAASGVRFTDFYAAAPVCSASRAALLTGCYSQRVGLADYQVLFPGQAQGLNPRECTIARQLKQVGYATKIIGKWHCGDNLSSCRRAMVSTSTSASPSATTWVGRSPTPNASPCRCCGTRRSSSSSPTNAA